MDERNDIPKDSETKQTEAFNTQTDGKADAGQCGQDNTARDDLGSATLQDAASREADPIWLRNYEETVPHSMNYPETAAFHWLDESADKFPKSLAISYHNTDITYAGLRKSAEIFAANLRKQGVQPGDRVGIMLPNLPQSIIAFWGVLKAGAVVTMFNPLYMEKELRHQVSDADIRCMITHDACWPKFAKLRDSIGIERYFVTTVTEGFSFPLNIMERFKASRSKQAISVPFDGRQVLPFSTLLKGKERLSHPVENPRETLALLQYTGGTTGLSKGAMLSHYNVTSNACQMGEYIGFMHKEEQTFIGVLPFFHVYGLNTSIVLPTYFHSRVVPITRFVPLELLQTMKKYNATALPGAPAMYISLLQQKTKGKFSLDSLKICISGSAPMPVEMMRLFEKEFNTRIMEGYGLSEACPITHMTPARGMRKVGSIGLPLPDTEARIVDMELGIVPLAPGKLGELVIKGPQVMSGYWNKPDETAGTLRNGWLYTGDIATMDEDGFFTIVDRKKDMIIVAGYNVSPREIDEVLYEHPKVREAVSVGVPHHSRGEVIKAYIVLKEGETSDRAEIVAWCRERLANYKVPRMVEFRDELPKTLVGKILRRVLRAEEEAKQKQRSKEELVDDADNGCEHDCEHGCGHGDLGKMDQIDQINQMDQAAQSGQREKDGPDGNDTGQQDPAQQ
ncbi:long-chain fatty acid--CoA ligase [Desulfovibrio sp. OttesenSCG-928-G15]|nr:long-chain fatty acid--CoA ligase [Desulfovibrio sp. OttesenSCG-928-G15]